MFKKGAMENQEADEQNENFEGWNPIEADFLNDEFNLRDTDPGIDLQPDELAKPMEGLSLTAASDGWVKEKRAPFLIFKELPRQMTEKSIKNMCEGFGKVKEVETKSKWVYVKFYSIADMESVYRGLSGNEFGIKVEIGKHFLNQRKPNDLFEPFKKDGNRSLKKKLSSSSEFFSEQRSIRAAPKNPPRPKFESEELHAFDKVNGAISKNDPLRHALQRGDAHNLERAGVSVATIATKIDDEYTYTNGRAHLNMQENSLQFLKERHEKSNGKYDAVKETYYSNTKEKENLPNLYYCIVCKSPADISCYRCHPKLYIYCGTPCQNQDWENHRKVCGQKIDNENISMPQKNRVENEKENGSPLTPKSGNQSKRENTAQVEKSLSFSSDNLHDESGDNKEYPKPDMPPTNSLVAMTAVSRTNVVFIRSMLEANNAKFFEIINKIQHATKKLKRLQQLPKLGDAVIAKFQTSKEYGRAVVLHVADAENIKINFLDYGNIEKHNLSNLYKAQSKFIDLPRFAIPVVLKNVPNYYMTNEVRNFMYMYLRNVDLIVKYDQEKDLIPITNIYEVDLFDATTNQHLNQIIAELCKPHEPNSVDELVNGVDLKVMPLPVGKNIQFYVMDNSQLEIGCISCTTKEFALEIQNFSEDIQRYGNSLKPQLYAPREEELCIAKYSDNLWYRGKCVEKVGDGKPSILFIDYGNIAYVKVSDIRPYPQKFNWPIFTSVCGIDGLPEIVDEKLVERLEKLLPCCFPVNCDSVKKIENEDFYSITLNGVNKILKDEKLLY